MADETKSLSTRIARSMNFSAGEMFGEMADDRALRIAETERQISDAKTEIERQLAMYRKETKEQPGLPERQRMVVRLERALARLPERRRALLDQATRQVVDQDEFKKLFE